MSDRLWSPVDHGGCLSSSEDKPVKMSVREGRVSSSVLLSAGRDTAALQVNPADVPALEIKLGALVVLLSITVLFGFTPLCIVRGGAGRCSVEPGEERTPELRSDLRNYFLQK